MITFERNIDPKKSIGIGRRALYFKLKPQSIIRLINDDGFDPTLNAKKGDLLLIDHIDKNCYNDPDPAGNYHPDRMDIFYYIIDELGRTNNSEMDQWIIDPDFFIECFEVVKL